MAGHMAAHFLHSRIYQGSHSLAISTARTGSTRSLRCTARAPSQPSASRTYPHYGHSVLELHLPVELRLHVRTGRWSATWSRSGGTSARRAVRTRAMDPEREQLYLQLGVAPGASMQAVKKAYKQAAKKWHPDVCDDPDAIERFIAAHTAYEAILADNGSLDTVAQAWMRDKWQSQVRNLRQRQADVRAKAQERKEQAQEFATAEEERKFKELQRNHLMYATAAKRDQVKSQLTGLQERAQRRKRRPKPAKQEWVEPAFPNEDDEWYHGVQ